MNMYPAHFFALFPPFPRQDTVFVAMSFDGRFNARWKTVIEPAVQRITKDDKLHLKPIRVDVRKVSDSILTEILDGIRKSRLIFADITTIGHLGETPIRNANVMYEVGIAHAVRLPEEVVLFRSDDDSLLFDTSNIRVNKYNPDSSPESSRDAVTTALLDAIKEIDLRRHIEVQRVAESLDETCLMILAEAQSKEGLEEPEMKSLRHVVTNTRRLAAINRLLETGAIKASYARFTPELLKEKGDQQGNLISYKSTEFGNAVFKEIVMRLGILSPEMQKVLEARHSVLDA